VQQHEEPCSNARAIESTASWPVRPRAARLLPTRGVLSAARLERAESPSPPLDAHVRQQVGSKPAASSRHSFRVGERVWHVGTATCCKGWAIESTASRPFRPRAEQDCLQAKTVLDRSVRAWQESFTSHLQVREGIRKRARGSPGDPLALLIPLGRAAAASSRCRHGELAFSKLTPSSPELGARINWLERIPVQGILPKPVIEITDPKGRGFQ
jgi:hypothetical protein